MGISIGCLTPLHFPLSYNYIGTWILVFISWLLQQALCSARVGTVSVLSLSIYQGWEYSKSNEWIKFSTWVNLGYEYRHPQLSVLEMANFSPNCKDGNLFAAVSVQHFTVTFTFYMCYNLIPLARALKMAVFLFLII